MKKLSLVLLHLWWIVQLLLILTAVFVVSLFVTAGFGNYRIEEVISAVLEIVNV
ncbi:hypothetical protein [Dyadobacter sandarakinus]|uniref:Uncharacterized protein n=1 Tax=Dyadobacter sandarakinus TaxID=2747268 RepID=A0ABX7I3X5_9BACT|nr:hypothetical protein [Dyadobacter sandarakinus]QRQ99750.1 hypothetical protein HWI92_01860 [Dyadobacter sandarakinus]